MPISPRIYPVGLPIGLYFLKKWGILGKLVIKLFKCSDECILRQIRLLDKKKKKKQFFFYIEHMYIKSIHRDMLQDLLFIYTIIL